MASYSIPALPKPVTCRLLTRQQAEQQVVVADLPLILIDCKGNLGFAGGCNVGLRFTLEQQDMAWAWLR